MPQKQPPARMAFSVVILRSRYRVGFYQLALGPLALSTGGMNSAVSSFISTAAARWAEISVIGAEGGQKLLRRSRCHGLTLSV
jgi:hypothetical protein